MFDYYLTQLGIIEVIASVASIACVWLLAKQSVWNFAWGILGVVLFGYIFYEFKLYSDMLLQLAYFLPIQIFGAWFWLNGRGATENSQIPIVEESGEQKFWSVFAIAAIVLSLGTVMGNLTDAAVPYLDATIVGCSVVAQYLLTKKVLHNWLIWIAMDVFAVWFFYSRGLYVTSGLYVVFFFLACYGYSQWLRAYKNQQSQLKGI